MMLGEVERSAEVEWCTAKSDGERKGEADFGKCAGGGRPAMLCGQVAGRQSRSRSPKAWRGSSASVCKTGLTSTG